MKYFKKILFKFKQKSKTRQFRRYVRVLTRLILIAILVWLFLFVFYAFLVEFEKFLRKQIKSLFSDSEIKIPETFSIDRNDVDFKDPKYIDRKSLEFFERIQRITYEVNCQSLIEWDEFEVRKAKRILFKLKNLNNEHLTKINDVQKLGLIPTLPNENYVFDKSMCKLFRELRGYDSYKITSFEKTFPIAFTILTYDNVEQFERLLRAIYRPQNVYCIHIDSKSPPLFHEAVKSIVQCFNNVFVSTKLERVVYAGFSRLKADINCMHDLISPNYEHAYLREKNITSDWKYLLNMASSEFPLRTNYELARILQMFNGANDIEVITNMPMVRIQYSWKPKRKPNTTYEYMVRTKRLKAPIPHNYTIVKGLAYCSFSRKFIEYVLSNTYARNLLKWSEDTYSPDEWYWATLNYNTQFNPPGGFKDPKRTAIPTKARYIGWKNSYKCMGELRHNLCVFSIEDLPELVTRNEFFLNKFLLQYDPISYQCMEEWLNSKISLYQTVNIINYCRLLFVVPYSINPTCARLLDKQVQALRSKTTSKKPNLTTTKFKAKKDKI
ncbi:unnamed protein product [Brachionus calyciflorus]|uniref:Uncharacterized protein n=1 Tax=Brachionus calyciflorus TaxID=104777 RepID=A0A813TGU1_9BILA|nr:unnamed protein product [Brachionus calyciflorus]